MNSKGCVVILLRPFSIGIPAISNIKGFVAVHGILYLFFTPFPPHAAQRQVGDHLKVLPVVVCLGVPVDLIQPVRQTVLFLLFQRIPQFFRNHQDPVADRSHFDHPLILVV